MKRSLVLLTLGFCVTLAAFAQQGAKNDFDPNSNFGKKTSSPSNSKALATSTILSASNGLSRCRPGFGWNLEWRNLRHREAI